jgi:LysR family transcriptional regulator, glycine cleavage system transcriptional activator
MHTPSLRFLKTFHIAGKRGSFKAAAEELCVTASAVSHQMKVLEQQLGLALFDRGPRSLTLTAAGAHYLETVDTVFARLECVTAQLRRRCSRTVVRLQVPPFFASELLVPRLSSFSALHDDIDLRIESDIAPNEHHSAQVDVSIVVGSEPWPHVQATRLFAQSYVAACSPELLRGRHIGTASDLAQEPLIAHRHRLDLWDRWAALFGIPSLRPKQLIEFDSMASIVHAAEQGVGIALVSAPLAAAHFASGALVRVFDTELAAGDSYYVVTRHEDAQQLGVQALVRWLLQQYGATN